ncbi:cytochrome P450 94A2-like [Nicotiana tomentosiformis]|uniref:cytochrome P450 94A2-like n=1 Tax=Nicotiana tomentosiformis TaxID=4098 RepID=UPI00051B53E4|nr:cytochrome P450 94A2-like [Nicotiana tomentosiformis]
MFFNFDLRLIFSQIYFYFLPLVFFLFFINFRTNLFFLSKSTKIPRSYPIIGSYFSIKSNKNRRIQWTSDIVLSRPTLTFTLRRPFGHRHIFTGNSSNVQHILKNHFHNYQKGYLGKETLKDLLGNGIFNADGEIWKYQRKLASHEFNSKSLRKFVEKVVNVELCDRLIPILTMAAASQNCVIDIQDLLQRFAFDNICMVAYGYDPAYLLPSFPEAKFANAFEEVVRISSERFNSLAPFIWKLKRILNVGSEKKLKVCATQIREMAKEIIKEKKSNLTNSSGDDLLSRFLISSEQYQDEEFIIDIVISFILAGRDTTSAALTWFFWLIFKNPNVEKEILEEIAKSSNESSTYDEVKDMPYTHASLCESMRFFPPVPVDTKEAMQDDILPDGTFVKRGTRISYHPYAMGRAEAIWGKDWQTFKPERWLERDVKTGNWKFVPRDPFVYPVFQAGPRVCLGKEMAFLQMKKVVVGVLRRFRVVPVVEKGEEEPVLIAYLTTKMKGGFLVRIEERIN